MSIAIVDLATLGIKEVVDLGGTVFTDLVPVVAGPQGPPGVAGGAAYIHTQVTSSASWSITNPLSRMCGVTIYVSDELIEADVTVTTSSINVTFATPQSGILVLT